jgi:hypothetical protein
MGAIKNGHPPHAWRGPYPKYEIIAVKTICSKPACRASGNEVGNFADGHFGG